MCAGNSGAFAIHALYSTDNTVLFMERPHENPYPPNPYLTVGNNTELACVYNINSNTFTPLHFTSQPFCSGHSMGPSGEGWIFSGGQGCLTSLQSACASRCQHCSLVLEASTL